MASKQETVTFKTPEGTEMTCSPELAKKFGYSGESALEPKKAPAKKSSK